MKTVSIIIPAYNAKDYIVSCVESVENQTYKSIEVIIVNDGSKDNTLEICKDLSNKYNNLKIINKKNEGPSIARKTGIEHATGDYLAFIDSDDTFEVNAIQILVDALEKSDADIVECGYNLVDEQENMLEKKLLQKEIIDSNNSCVEAYIKQKNTTNFLCNKLYKKSLFEELEFKKFYASEDSCILLQLFSKCNKVIRIPDCLYNYVQTATSLCRKPYNLKRNDAVFAGEYMYNYCKKHYFQYKEYYSSYICSYASKCYANLKYSNIEDKEKYMQEMKKYFDKYYITNIDNLDISPQRKRLIRLFNFSPYIASLVYKKVLKK